MLNILKLSYLLIKEYLYFLYHKDYNKWIQNNIYNISEINILYIKLFQSLAYNNELIDETINKHIIKYTNNVPFFKSDIDESLLINLQKQYNLLFDSFTPINSGLISLIFKAKYRDGKDIILKIKRKNIDIILNNSIEEINGLINIISFFPIVKKLKIKEIFHKNIYLLKEQLNFDLEINNIQKFQDICKNIDYVVIPHVYTEMTFQYPNVIMMEFIKGKQLHSLDMNNILLKKAYSKMILKISILSFLSGNIHGDLHSGNILFLEDEVPKICLLDFGLVLKIDKNVIKLFFNIIEDLYEKDAEELSVNLLKIIINNFELLNKAHSDNLLKIITEIIHNVKIKNNKYNIYHYFQCINIVIKYIDKHKLTNYLNEDFYKLNVSFFMSSSIITKLCHIELFELMNDVCNELFHIDLL